MPHDGAGQNDARAERVTSDDWEDWFPHPSPDGKWLVFVSFPPGTKGHNDRTLPVQLRRLPLPGSRVIPATPEMLATFTGGQGTMNVNSWSPDGKAFAYVTLRHSEVIARHVGCRTMCSALGRVESEASQKRNQRPLVLGRQFVRNSRPGIGSLITPGGLQPFRS